MQSKGRISSISALILIAGGGLTVILTLGLMSAVLLSQPSDRLQNPQPTPSFVSHATDALATNQFTTTTTFTETPIQRESLTSTGEITPSPLDLSTPLPGPFANLEFPPLGKIVFTCTPEGYNQLCLMNADGSNYTRLTDHKANDYYPSLARDGQSIFFVSNRSFQFEVYVTKIDGSDLRQLTHQIGNVTAPELSPDGSQIVFALKKDGNSSIWIAGSDGSAPHPITGDQWDEIDPTWSPDGQRIAFAAMRGGYVELFSMKPDGSDIRQETQGVYGIGGRSSWSPDGKKLVFYAGPNSDRDIYIVEIGSGHITRLTQGGNNTGPCFSPDGHWIAFSSSRNGDHEIYIMQVDGSHVTQLTENSYDDWQPRWGP